MGNRGTAPGSGLPSSARHLLHADCRPWINRDELGHTLSEARLALSLAHLWRAYVSALLQGETGEVLETFRAVRAQARLPLVWPSQSLARGDAGNICEHCVGQRM